MSLYFKKRNMISILLYVTLLLFLETVENAQKSADKRVLLNDNSYIETLERKLQNLTTQITTLTVRQKEFERIMDGYTKKLRAYNDIGGVYVRWGRADCPETADLVYTGYVGGSWYNDIGAAVNYLCVHEFPQWWNLTGTTTAAYLYGGEYQDEFYSVTPLRDFEPTCSVCMANRSSILMMAGRTECLEGWTMEYNGYLSAGHRHFNAGSEYVCLDENPVRLSVLGYNHNGKQFYPVGSKCGSLPCPPFEEGREMACVVCSK